MRLLRRAPRRIAGVVLLLAVVASCLVGLSVWEGRGLMGAVIGSILAVGFALSGPWLLEPVARRQPAAALPAALGLYTLKAVVAIVALGLLSAGERWDDTIERGALALALAVVTAAWVAVQLATFAVDRTPTYDLDNSPG